MMAVLLSACLALIVLAEASEAKSGLPRQTADPRPQIDPTPPRDHEQFESWQIASNELRQVRDIHMRTDTAHLLGCLVRCVQVQLCLGVRCEDGITRWCEV